MIIWHVTNVICNRQTGIQTNGSGALVDNNVSDMGTLPIMFLDKSHVYLVIYGDTLPTNLLHRISLTHQLTVYLLI